MEAINKSTNGLSYSTEQPYDRVETSSEDRPNETWPEPPTPQKPQLPPLPLEKVGPPSRVPPRVMPKPRAEHTIRSPASKEDMFV